MSQDPSDRAQRAKPRLGDHDERRERRQELHYDVAIEAIEDGSITACRLVDISETGARLLVPTEAELGGPFLLRLARNRPWRRLCRPIWRDGESLGVEFIP